MDGAAGSGSNSGSTGSNGTKTTKKTITFDGITKEVNVTEEATAADKASKNATKNKDDAEDAEFAQLEGYIIKAYKEH